MADQKPAKKTIVAIGFNGPKTPPRAKSLLGGGKMNVFTMMRKVHGCSRFVSGDLATFKGTKGELYNPATAKDDNDVPIIKEWRKDGDLMIGEI